MILSNKLWRMHKLDIVYFDYFDNDKEDDIEFEDIVESGEKEKEKEVSLFEASLKLESAKVIKFGSLPKIVKYLTDIEFVSKRSLLI